MPKISQYPSQSGAAVANGDLIPIVDVGSPNVTERITVDELAQAPQFSSRYKPLANDVVWIDAGAFVPTNGTSQGSQGAGVAQRTGVINFPDGASSVSAAASFRWPPGWATATVALYWMNGGGGAGNVVWGVRVLTLADGDTLAANGSSPASDATIAAPGSAILRVSSFTATPLTATAGNVARITVIRFSSDAGDTLTNDASLMGVAIVRAS